MTALRSLAVVGAVAGASLSAHAGQGTFTVIGLPDTQNYSENFPEIFLAQTLWVAENLEALDIQFVSHYGDVVQHGDDLSEWANAEVALSVLDDIGVPWGVTPGNHDLTPSGSATEPYIPQFFRERYGPEHWAGRPWFAGSSPSGMSNAQIFTAAGMEWLWLHIECDLPVREMAWAQGMLDLHRDKPAVVTTHRYLQDAEDYTGGVPIVPSGRYPGVWYSVEGIYTDGGVQIGDAWKWFVRKNTSICLVNCGHFHEEYRQTSTNVAGLPVHEVLADYQDDPNGGNGWLRIMTFDVAGSQIHFESYSPTLDEQRFADESHFSLPVAFDAYRTAPGTRFVAFQQGINGYAGTQDTWVNEASPDTSYGNSSTRTSDDDTENSVFFGDDRGQALIRFDGIVTGDGAGLTIPAGSEILSAHLTLELADDHDNPLYDPDFFVYEVIRDWNESSTWNSLGGGLSPVQDLGELVAVFPGDNDPDGDETRRMQITGLVQRWVDGQTNYGIAILPEIISGNDDGIDIYTSESGNEIRRPRLEVVYVDPAPPCPADISGDGAVGVADLLEVLSAWGPCPGGCDADITGDEVVGVADLLALLSAWGPC